MSNVLANKRIKHTGSTAILYLFFSHRQFANHDDIPNIRYVQF